MKFDLDQIPRQTKLVIFGCWFLSLMISLSVYVGGIASQLTFGSDVCLLYIENYRDQTGVGWIFDTYSPTCGASVTFGSLALILLFAITLFRGYFLYRDQEPSRQVILSLFVITAVWTLVSIVMALILSLGISKTCQEFEKRGRSCGAIFGDGFYVNDKGDVYRKNIDTVYASNGAGWVVCLFWGLYAAFEYTAYKSSSLRWW